MVCGCFVRWRALTADAWTDCPQHPTVHIRVLRQRLQLYSCYYYIGWWSVSRTHRQASPAGYNAGRDRKKITEPPPHYSQVTPYQQTSSDFTASTTEQFRSSESTSSTATRYICACVLHETYANYSLYRVYVNHYVITLRVRSSWVYVTLTSAF